MRKFLFADRLSVLDLIVIFSYLPIFASLPWLLATPLLFVVLFFAHAVSDYFKPQVRLFTFGVDPHGNPSLVYHELVCPADRGAINDFANAGVNQTKALIYANIKSMQTRAGLTPKEKNVLQMMREHLQASYPII